MDDDEGVRVGMEDMLTVLGHRALVVENVEQALETLSSDPGIEVVLTDFQMPGRTGADLLREMRRRGDARPVILTSGYGSELKSDDPIQPDLLLGKPLLLAELDRALKEVVG